MPFTFSHPALVLPVTLLPKRFYSLTGLIAGSVAPDFEYIFRAFIHFDYSHNLRGMLSFNLPMGILIAILFHTLIRDSFIEHLPGRMRARFIGFVGFNWWKYFLKNVWIVIASVLVGAFSHLLWDSFTHSNGYFVRMIPALRVQVEVFGLDFYFFRILQHSSSIIGAACILYAIKRMEPVSDEIPSSKFFRYWSIVCGFTMVFVVVRFLLFSENFHHYTDLGVDILLAGIIALVVTPFLMKLTIAR